jgi:predicted Zn-dependent protease
MWLATIAAMLALILPQTISAQEEVAAGKPPAGKKSDGKPDKPKRFPELSEVIKDMQTMQGLFTLYRYDPSDKDRDPEKLLCKIPKNLLNEDLLFATSISRGGSFTGWMWRTHLVRWEIVGKHLKMLTPETHYVQKKGKPVTDVIERTYNDRYIASVPIVSMTNAGEPVIDLGALLKTNLADVSFMGGGVRRELSKWAQVKVFPDNVLVDVDLALGARQGGGRMVGVSYAFRRLPKLGSYEPRQADDRIGYFLTARIDWTKKHAARDTFDRYINRWKLEKRDASLELSPPKRPITFIIEKTVPIQWRRWVRDGILEWNKAFEKIGFVDAIVVQQQTDDNEFADYDPEDARYNFFRWIVSGRSFAMGPSRVDPRTGQILDADIIMDDSFVRVYMQEFDLLAPSATAQLKGPAFELWRERYPDLAAATPFQHIPEALDEEQRILEMARQKLHAHGQHVCFYPAAFQQQMALVRNALIATGSGKKLPERFIGEAIKEVVTHEVGHTLGLRHNFKGSSWLTLDEIKSRRDNTDEPTCASIMDYNPLLFFQGDTPESVRHFVTPTIGPWDYWVIEYGYAQPKKGQSEKEMLAEIASRCTQPELAYATDEDTLGAFSPDPLSNRFDMSSDLDEWTQSRIALCDELLPNVMDWAIKDGEARYFARQAFQTLWFEKARNFEFAARLIGGQHFHRHHKGDPDARPAFELVDPEAQRRALRWLGETLFDDAFFRTDADLLNKLAPSRWSHFRSSPDIRLDFPIHDWIGMMQWWTLADIASPPVLQRIYDAELKSDADNKYTAAEHIRKLRDTIWAQLRRLPKGAYTDAQPYISSIDRNLQRQYLDLMIAYARQRPGSVTSPDLSSMIRQSLRELSSKIGRALRPKTEEDERVRLDFASRAHLTDCKSRVDRVLEAQFMDK